jgi:hypothetical protein
VLNETHPWVSTSSTMSFVSVTTIFNKDAVLKHSTASKSACATAT